MTGLYIFLGILAFFVFIFTLKIKVILIMPSPDDVSLTVKICGIPIRILPAKEKKVKLSRYSKKEMEKRRLAEIEKARKKAKKKEEKKRKKEEKKRKEKEKLEKLRKEGKLPPDDKKKEKPYDPTAITLVDNINAATAAIGKFFVRFGRRFRIDVSRIIITIATGDAASTAIMYGAAVPAVMALIALLEKITDLRGIDKADIHLRCDYLAQKTTVDVHVAFSMRPYHLFDMLFSALFAFLGKRKAIKDEKVRMAARRKKAAQIITAKRQKMMQQRKSNSGDPPVKK